MKHYAYVPAIALCIAFLALSTWIASAQSLNPFRPFQGGTGTSSIPTYGQVLVGNSSGTYSLVSTSSLGIVGAADGAFSTTSADYWKTVRNFFSTTSVDYWETTQPPRGGTSPLGTSTVPTGGHVAVWTSTGYPSLLGSIATGSVSGSGGISVSANRYVLNGALSIVCAVASASQPGCLSLADWTTFNTRLSTTSLGLFDKGYFFSTTSAQYFVHSSTTIPKTYTANNFTATQTFTYASTTGISGNFVCISTDCRTSWPSGASGGLATSSPWTVGNIVRVLTDGTVTSIATSSLNIAISDTTGTLAVSRGGTGATTFSAGQLLYGSGTNAVASVATSTLSASSPLSLSGTTVIVGTARTLSIADAAANGSTKGAASFTANDFDATSGNVSLDYTNGQKATGSVPGFLSSTDWNTFNGKESVLTFTYPLTRSTNTIALAFGTTTANAWSSLQAFTNASSSLFSTTYGSSTDQVIGRNLTFGGVTGNSWDDFCTAITGSSALCDGDDASGGGASFSYPFPNDATTTVLKFTTGLSVGSSTPMANSFLTIGTSTWSGIHINSETGKIGFGCINDSPSRWAFGCGTNININPNINLLVQDPADSRMGSCTSDDCIILKSAAAALGLYGFDYAAGIGKAIIVQEFGGIFDMSLATVKQKQYPTWTWPGSATTTTSTTTVPLGSAFVVELWNASECRVTSGSSGYRYSDGTNAMNYVAATTTESRFALSSNNSFTAGERRVAEVGPLTNAQITCTLDKTVNN